MGRGLPGASWEGATERQHHSRYSLTTGGREGGCPAARPLQLALIQGVLLLRSCDFSAKGLSFDWTKTGQWV